MLRVVTKQPTKVERGDDLRRGQRAARMTAVGLGYHAKSMAAKAPSGRFEIGY
jgi:hypothetical protein